MEGAKQNREAKEAAVTRARSTPLQNGSAQQADTLVCSRPPS